MDTYNETEPYQHRMRAALVNQQKARTRKGQQPRDRCTREYAHKRFMHLFRHGIIGTAHPTAFNTYIPPAYPPCVSPLADLSPLMIKDLQLEIHHRRNYIRLRPITPPCRHLADMAIMALMEDENGDVLRLQIYQQEEDCHRVAESVIDATTVMIIKAPYLKLMADGDYGLRVDHLSDVVRIGNHDPSVPLAWQPQIVDLDRSMETLHVKGNEAMGEERYWDAIKDYSEALLEPGTDELARWTRRNRALAYLNTKHYDAVLVDVNYPEFDNEPTEKGLYRAAVALYHLRRFPESAQVLESLHSMFDVKNYTTALSDRARQRLIEQQTGQYDFTRLQGIAKRKPLPLLDCATYKGPMEVRQTESKGRGLFTTQPVRAGDLLLCEKAFTYFFVSDNLDNENGGSSEAETQVSPEAKLMLNPQTNQCFLGGQVDLLRETLHKLHRNPSLVPEIASLHHGDYKTLIDDAVIVDTFLIERMIALNVIGATPSTFRLHRKLIDEPVPQETPPHYSCGLWPLASSINHSCIPTARRSFISDMLIVRATADLPADTEITFWYASPEQLSQTAMQARLAHWGFECTCALCEDTRARPAATKKERHRLLRKITRGFEAPVLDTDKIQRWTTALADTYARPAREVPRVLVYTAQLSLTRAYQARSAARTLESGVMALSALGFVVVGADTSFEGPFEVLEWGWAVTHGVELFKMIRGALLALGKVEDANRAGGYAKTLYRILVGEDETFASVHRL